MNNLGYVPTFQASDKPLNKEVASEMKFLTFISNSFFSLVPENRVLNFGQKLLINLM